MIGDAVLKLRRRWRVSTVHRITMPGTTCPLCIRTLGPLRENGRIARFHLNELSFG